MTSKDSGSRLDVSVEALAARLKAIPEGDWRTGGQEPAPVVERIVAEAGIDSVLELTAAAMTLTDPLRTLVVLEALWRAQPVVLASLAAFRQLAGRLPVESLVPWAGRLRARGLGASCPLLQRAGDATRPKAERIDAARAAWEHFFDPQAAGLLVALGEPVPDAVPDYYRHSRPEVVACVPLGARRVLDLGCAAGRLGASIRHRQPAEVVGVELSADAAAKARDVLSAVHVGDVDAGVLDDLETSSFDTVVAADVLEHVRDPWSALRCLADKLRPGGTAVVSIPNIANLGVMSSLVAGRFDYQDAGILDRTHLRFFTRQTALELVAGAGLDVESVGIVRDPGISEVPAPGPGQSIDVGAGQLQVKNVDAAMLQDLTAMQFVITARKRKAMPDTARPEVWDCVLFFNELDMLEARLVELEGLVDHLVVVEATETFRGTPKPLHFDENRARFERFDVAIHHVVVQFGHGSSAWDRERAQRESVLQAVSGAAPTALLLCCDVDELVGRHALERIVEATSAGPVSLEMPLYYYSRRWRSPQRWIHPKALRARDLPTSLEELRNRTVLPVVDNAGWHLSYFGGADNVHAKLRSYSHAEYDNALTHDAVPELLSRGLTVHGIQLQAVDDLFPPHLVERFPLDEMGHDQGERLRTGAHHSQ